MAKAQTKKGAAQEAVKKKDRKNVPSGVAHVNASFNNTIVTITDPFGNAIAWSSSGANGFKGSRKSTPYASQIAAEVAGKKAMEHGMRTVEVEQFCSWSACRMNSTSSARTSRGSARHTRCCD